MLCCINSNRSNPDYSFQNREINKSYYNDLIVMQKIKELPDFDWTHQPPDGIHRILRPIIKDDE